VLPSHPGLDPALAPPRVVALRPDARKAMGWYGVMNEAVVADSVTDLITDVLAESLLHGASNTVVAEMHGVFDQKLTAKQQLDQAAAQRRESITAGVVTRPSHNVRKRPATVGDGRRHTLGKLRPQAWGRHHREIWGSGSLKVHKCRQPSDARIMTAPAGTSRREKAEKRYKTSLENVQARRKQLQSDLLMNAIAAAEAVGEI